MSTAFDSKREGLTWFSFFWNLHVISTLMICRTMYFCEMHLRDVVGSGRLQSNGGIERGIKPTRSLHLKAAPGSCVSRLSWLRKKKRIRYKGTNGVDVREALPLWREKEAQMGRGQGKAEQEEYNHSLHLVFCCN